MGGLTLGELEALAGSGLAGLLALTCTWVTTQKAGGFEGGTKFGIVLDQGAGDGQFDGIGLAVKSTSAGDGLDVELVLKAGDLKRLEKLALESQGGQDFFEGVFVDGDFSGSGGDPDAGNGGLATSGCSKSFAHSILGMSLGLESDGLGFLGFVRVGVTGVNLEFLHLGGAKLGFWNHAFHSPLENELGTTLADLRGSLDGLTTDVAGVAGVNFVLLLASGEAGVLCIDDDNEVTGIYVRREYGLMLPAKETGSLHCDFSDDLVLGIDDVP